MALRGYLEHGKRTSRDSMYARLLDAGWPVREADVERDVELLFGGAFEAFLAK